MESNLRRSGAIAKALTGACITLGMAGAARAQDSTADLSQSAQAQPADEAPDATELAQAPLDAPTPVHAAPEHRPVAPAAAPAQTGAAAQGLVGGEQRLQPGIAPHAPYYYKNKGPKIDSTHYAIRFEEDFSFLNDPKAPRDFFSPFKFIKLNNSGTSYITLNALQRTFAEQTLIEVGPGGRPLYTHQHDYEFRQELGIDVHLTNYFRAYADVINAVFHGEPQFFNSGAFRNEFTLLNAFVEPKVQVGIDHLGLRLGRQQISLGNGNLVDIGNDVNVPMSFDGVRAYSDWGFARIDAFWTQEVALYTGYFNEHNDGNLPFYGAYGSWDFYRGPSVLGPAILTIEPFVLGYGAPHAEYDNPATETSLGTYPRLQEDNREYGARFAAVMGNFDTDNTALYEDGHLEDLRLTAWAFQTQTGYTFHHVALQPRLFLQFDGASGGGDAQKGVIHSWQPDLFRPSYYDLQLLLGPTNAYDLHPGLELQLAKDVRVGAFYGLWWRQNDDDAVYWGLSEVAQIPNAYSDTAKVRGSFTGQVPTGFLTWNIVPHVDLRLEASYFMPSSAMRLAGLRNAFSDEEYIRFTF